MEPFSSDDIKRKKRREHPWEERDIFLIKKEKETFQLKLSAEEKVNKSFCRKENEWKKKIKR